jgi:hypothetical protein
MRSVIVDLNQILQGNFALVARLQPKQFNRITKRQRSKKKMFIRLKLNFLLKILYPPKSSRLPKKIKQKT